MRLYNVQDGYIFYIPDINCEYSPLLRTMLTTSVGIDRDDDGNILIDCDPYSLKQYASFLIGEEFEMNEDVEELFEYFGHENTLGYPLDFWKIKLYDTWIRDMCYKLELFKDNPYYGLYELGPIIQGYDGELPKNHYIAGGAVLTMLGITKKYTDIDIFTTDVEESKRYIKVLIDTQDLYYTENSVIYGNIQIILRSYSCPSEIVHGFDVGCCGVIAEYTDDGYKIYCTRRTLYSIINRCNWIEPDRSSPSYIYRLLKYSNRNAFIGTWWEGIDVRAPGFNIWTRENITVPYADSNMGGFKIMLVGTDNIRIDPTYYDRIYEKRVKSFMESEDKILRSDESINLRDMLFEYYQDHDHDYDIQYEFMVLMRKYGIIDSIPIPLIPKSIDTNLLVKHVYESLKNNSVSFRDPHIDQIYASTVLEGVNMQLSSMPYIPQSIDELDKSLDVNIQIGTILESYSIYDVPLYDLEWYIPRYSFLKNVHNPLAYIIRQDIGELTEYSDPASLLILQCMYGIGYMLSLKMKRISDYGPNEKTDIHKLIDIDDITFKYTNPMEQLTGSFHPETIQDIEEWFKTSPLIQEDGIPIISRRYNN